MKRSASIILLVSALFLTSCNENKTTKQEEKVQIVSHDHSEMMKNLTIENDHRISLNLPPKKAQHQLMNMRSHLMAVQSILSYLSQDEFDKAAEEASSKLGLTEEMKMMCSSFDNEEFQKLGFEFHENADKMSEVFKTGDKNKSLEALSITIESCVSCHSAFKQ